MEYEYDITLSFAGEDREYVDKVASHLEQNDVKVFYDKFEEVDLWGKDLGLHFDHIYRKSAKFCIPFISKSYKEKVWTNYELRNAISRAIENNEEYILPVRFDSTEIDGIRPTLGYLDLQNLAPEKLAELIIKKLKMPVKKPVPEQLQEKELEILNISLFTTFITGGGPMGSLLKVSITNKIKGDYRYFYQPYFKLTKTEDGRDTFQLLNFNSRVNFPVKMEYGQEISIDYQLNEGQLGVWENLPEGCEFFAVISTTVGEKYESNLLATSKVAGMLR